MDVVVIAPQVAMLDDGRKVWRDSGVNLIHWPTTGIHHCSTSSIQIASKFWVSVIHVCWQGVATVKFHVVHFPVGKLLSILTQVAQNARIPGTGVVTKILVNAKLEASCVNLPRKSNIN